jgi:hypothetical protein
MRLRISKSLRFWVDCDYVRRKHLCVGSARLQLLAEILREYEEAGEAMRYLNFKGHVAWKTTPKMLTIPRFIEVSVEIP